MTSPSNEKPEPAPWTRLLRAAATPQVLVAALLLIAATGLVGPRQRRSSTPPPNIDVTRAQEQLTPQEVRLVLVDAAGLERTSNVRLQLPAGASQRLAAVMAALRDSLVQLGVWPAELPAPRVFVETFDRRKVAVVDMEVVTPIGVSVAQELAILRSLTATAEANGVAAVRFLRNGLPASTLLEHVAVPSSL
ncbi:MAG: hypothetical protein ROY82_06355 [Truepera sp.]|nr:hypothetical protein [Truepera sp.]